MTSELLDHTCLFFSPLPISGGPQPLLNRCACNGQIELISMDKFKSDAPLGAVLCILLGLGSQDGNTHLALFETLHFLARLDSMGCSWASKDRRRLAKSPASISALMPLLASRRDGRLSMTARGVPSREARSEAEGLARGPTIWKRPASILHDQCGQPPY